MKDYDITVIVELKAKFKQPTKDIYELAKVTEDINTRVINDARKKSTMFKNWFEKDVEVSMEIVEVPTSVES